jgi:hypothetical protein
MGLWDKVSGWFGKDATTRVEEGIAADSQAARDTAAKDYESFKDDQSIGGSYVGGAGAHADFEGDSKPPGNPAP